MENWWDALNLERQIFYGIGILALFGLGVQVLLSLFGGVEDHHDFAGGDGHLADHSSGLGLFSVRGITAFFLGFGWTGAMMLKAGHSLLAAIGAGFLVGGLFMVGIFLLLRSLLKFQSSGTLRYTNAIGQIATAYTTIPGDSKAGGQVEVMVQGRLITAEALHKNPSDIKPGTKVKVIEVLGATTLIVEPLS